LILGISILRGRTTNTSDTANTVANSSSSARRTNGFSSFSNAPASPYAMPQYAPRYAMPSSPTMSAPAPLPIATVNPGPMPPTPQQIQYAELQRLRQMTAYADAFVQATEQARAEQARQAAAAFSPMMPGRAMPASQMSQTQTFAMPM
jgi:type IV secretory pathway VirB10-like protein